MKQVTYSQFKTMHPAEIKEGPCLEVTYNQEHAFYIIVGAEQEMANQIIGRASQIDAARGKEG